MFEFKVPEDVLWPWLTVSPGQVDEYDGLGF